MFNTLRADFNRYYTLLPRYNRWQKFIFFLSCQGMWAILDYRWRRWLIRQPRWIRFFMTWPTFFFHIEIETQTGISLPTGCQIGKGLYIGHFTGIFIHDDVIMGENCAISQGVSIGLGGPSAGQGAPKIGDRVYIGAGAKVLGPITIGDGAAIGANAVVLQDVPAGATAVGIPARIIAKEEKEPSR